MTENNDFLSVLNDKNSIKNEETNEIILTCNELKIDDSYEILSSCSISSNCNTVIKCDTLDISANSVSLNGISFDGSIHVANSDNFKITNCTIKNSKLSDGAISIESSKSVYISHVTITDADLIAGIYITKDSTVTADNLLIYGIAETLLVCNTNSTLYLKDSNLHTTKANGIYTSNNSYIEIRNCKVSETDFPAIFVSTSNCVIESCEISNVAQNGISLNTCKSFVVSNNVIRDVKGSALSVLDESSGKAHRNKISDIGGNGIYVGGGSEIKAYKNEITKNQYPGIAILLKSNAKLIRNKISSITYSGICCRGARHVNIVKSDISDIQECGISVSDTKKCVIKHNNIRKCNIASVESYNRSRVYVIENDISDIKEHGFLVYTSAYMKVKNNNVSNIGKSMVKLLYRGGGDFIENQLQNCPRQKDGQTVTKYFFSGNGNFQGVTNDEEKKSETVNFEEDEIDCNLLCIKCNKNPRNCFLLDCGHKVYCKDCAEGSLKNKETCPLCRFPISNVTEGFTTNSDDMCVICFEKPADSIVAPCGHMGFCHHCLETWFKSNKNCPVCRAEPVTFKVIIKDL